MSVTQWLSGESSLHNMVWNFASKKSSAAFRKQACISLLQSVGARSPLCHDPFASGETTRTITFAPFAFLLPLSRVDISNFPESRSEKWQQRLLTEEDEQQPPSVHHGRRNVKISL